jgi:cupin fold WbuC family metalloprotein
MPFAFPNVTGDVFTLDEATLRTGCAEAAASPRRRIILPLHRTQDALVQRMLNFLQPGTYIQPHLHPLPHAMETIQVLRGALGFLIFEADGSIKSRHLLNADGLGLIDIESNVWHGFVVLEPDTVILEIKRGPYDPAHDKVFATWAPREGEAGTEAALAGWAEVFAKA